MRTSDGSINRTVIAGAIAAIVALTLLTAIAALFMPRMLHNGEQTEETD